MRWKFRFQDELRADQAGGVQVFVPSGKRVSQRVLGLQLVRLTLCCTIGRFRYIAWVKSPYRVAGKASALRTGKRA